MCCSPWGHRELDTTEQLNINHTSILPAGYKAPSQGESQAPDLPKGGVSSTDHFLMEDRHTQSHAPTRRQSV